MLFYNDLAAFLQFPFNANTRKRQSGKFGAFGKVCGLWFRVCFACLSSALGRGFSGNSNFRIIYFNLGFFNFRLKFCRLPSAICNLLGFNNGIIGSSEISGWNYKLLNFFFSPSKVMEANCIKQSSTSNRWFWLTLYFKSQSLAISIPFNKNSCDVF